MRARTEDLLTLRDGEPIDATLRERLAADPDNAREIERLTRVAEDLKRLPLLEPPQGVWERIAAEAPRRRAGPRRRYEAAAVAAAVAAIAAMALVAPRPSSDGGTETAAAPDASPVPALPLDAAPEPEPDLDYLRLVAESARLELMLAELEGSSQLMNAGTAGTIADLEDYIVLVDEQLNYAESRKLDLRYREALWRERVDVMNALLHVRYAQAQAVTY